MSTDRFTFEDFNAASGPYLHFQNIQTEDLHLFGILIDTKKCKVNKDVHRIFKQRYRFISVFAMEECYTEITQLKLGDNGSVDIKLSGDVLYQLAVVQTFPQVVLDQLYDQNDDGTNYTIKKFSYCTNLGPACIQQCVVNIENTPFDQCNTNNIIILNNLFKRQDQLDYFNQMCGNTEELTTLKTQQPLFKTLTQLRVFFADSAQKSFPYLRAGQPNIRIQIKFRSPQQLVNYTRNLASFPWQTAVKPTQMGFISTEIFLCEHERIIHTNTDANYLIEQNINYNQTGFNGVSFEPNFLHPVKFLYWAVQRQKYQAGNYFLSMKSFVDPNKYEQDFLYDATTRFILKFAGYKGFIDVTDLSAQTQGQHDNLVGTDFGQIQLKFRTDSHDVIQSCFSNLDSISLGQELNNTVVNIDSIFKRLGAQELIIDQKQRFGANISMVLPNLLTLSEASQTVSDLLTHVPSVGLLYKDAALVNVGPQVISSFLFSLHSNGAITMRYSNSNTLTSTVQRNAKTFFSAVLRDDNFNYGLDDFDVCVQQWDNYGKYLNRSGDSVITSEFLLGQTPRFKKAGFYTSQYHVYQYFCGKAPKGVHVYSFCNEPNQIQPTGSLNFSRATMKFKCYADSTDVDGNDQLVISALVYNICEFKENTFQLQFASPFQSI